MLDFIDERTRCAQCEEEFYTRDQSLASSRAAAKVLREHERLLTPDRIKAIRESFGLTQADFERALRLGPKTVVRWESGTVRQGATANSLLLAIEGSPATFWKVAAANGFTVPEFVSIGRQAGVEIRVSPDWLFSSMPIQFGFVDVAVPASTSVKTKIKPRVRVIRGNMIKAKLKKEPQAA
jgi:putative zinc finger/helix-turn-helix YgiT family protein